MDDELINSPQPLETSFVDIGSDPNDAQGDDEPRDIFQMFRNLGWSDRLEINEEKGFVKILATGDFILRKNRRFFELSFCSFLQEDNRLTLYGLNLIVDEKLNLLDFIDFWGTPNTNNYRYYLRNHWILRYVLGNITTIRISDDYSRELTKSKNTISLQVQKFNDLKSEVEMVYDKVKSSKGSLQRYLVNQLKFKFLNEKVGRTTSFNKGDFEFQVHRFNLETKTNKKKFEKYLNESDIDQLGQLFEKMLENEVFPEAYRTKLDNYFIKERLEDIIKLGREILGLKGEDVRTQVAEKVVQKVAGGTNQTFSQLESIWQKFFERHLLYLFFSYQKILPKVELTNTETQEKMYPDFVGINHYGGVDVIEIKTHLKKILVRDSSHSNFAFSSEMSKSMIQTINYMDAIADSKFQKTKQGKELSRHLNIKENFFRPRGIIIISSADRICTGLNKLTEDQEKQLQRDFTKLRNNIQNIQIFTFTEVLDIADAYIKNLI